MHYLDLQLFAEGEDAQVAEGAGEELEVGEVDTTTEEEAPQSFDDLIDSNPEYKDALGKKIQDAVSKRFKNQKDLQKQLDKLAPGLDILAQKYGLEANEGQYDYEDLMQRVMNDDKLYEEEAFERGMSVADLKHMKQLEADNARLNAQREAQAREEASREEFDEIARQGEELKAIYPNFNLGEELANASFGRLVANGIDVKTAYEVVHKDEILAGGMEYAVKQTKEKISKAIQSGSRPQENGLSSQSATSPGELDVSKLSLAQIREITARAQKGERITF
jgi:hypothetical protein